MSRRKLDKAKTNKVAASKHEQLLKNFLAMEQDRKNKIIKLNKEIEESKKQEHE